MAYSIMLDAGHGGQDPGAVYKGRQEKNDNLKLALAVGEILKNKGIDISYTRTGDVYQTPFEKAQLANQAGVDYFISFHRNSSPKENQYNGAAGTCGPQTNQDAGSFNRNRIYQFRRR